MCGIVGMVSANKVSSRLVKALLNLEYRGYDSCGLAVCSDGRIDIRKDKGHVQDVSDKLQFSEMDGTTGIGHTRWATTGAVTRQNAHPFVSNNGEFAVVHNGIITNYRKLRKKLETAGFTFFSETDTEVLVHLLDSEYRLHADIETAIRQMCRKLDGSYAFAVLSTHYPHQLFAARKDSPLIVGAGIGENFIGSDYNAILDYTRNVIPVKDGEYVVINRETVSIKNVLTGEKISRDIVTLDWDPELAQKGGFPHYMLKEIHEQPNTIDAALGLDKNRIQSICRMIMEADRVYLTGVGTTYFVAQCAQYYARLFSGKHLIAVSSDEFEYISELTERSVVIAFSQSGETHDTVNALKIARAQNARTVGVINVMGSRMVDLVDVAIMQNSGPEICVLSTKAAVSQIVISIGISLELGLMSGYLSTRKHSTFKTSLQQLSHRVRDVIDESKGFLHTLAKQTKHIKNWFFIGRGIYSAVAQESALKMKEVTYHHAEGIPGGFMKHGSIALIEDGFGSIFFLPPKSAGDLYELTITNAEEIKSRKGFVIAFGFGESFDLFDYQIRLKKADELTAPILLLILGQLFAYYSAVVLKRDVDKPRSLAKCVTVS